MTIGLALTLVAWIGAFTIAIVRPGAGLALALAAGRHTFPSRAEPLVFAAPLLIAASALGMLVRDGRLVPGRAAGRLAIVLAVVVAAGGAPFLLHDAPNQYGAEKLVLLLIVTIPIVLTTGALAAPHHRRDFLVGILGTGVALSCVALITSGGGTDRLAALGGGPIVLCQLCCYGLLLLTTWNDRLIGLLAPWTGPLLARSARWPLAALLAVTAVRSESRFPLISLVAVIGFEALAAVRRTLDPAEGRRVRRQRRALLTVMVAGAAALAFLVVRGDSRFALLANPTAELTRSRSGVWSHGLDQVADAGPLGLGFGAYAGRELAAPDDLRYAHNLFIELLSETGWLAGGLATLAIVAALWRVHRRTRDLSIRVLVGFAFLTTQSSGDLYNSRYLFVFLALAATVAALDDGPGDPELPDAQDTAGDRWAPAPDEIDLRRPRPSLAGLPATPGESR